MYGILIKMTAEYSWGMVGTAIGAPAAIAKTAEQASRWAIARTREGAGAFPAPECFNLYEQFLNWS
jgi:hypothetical protein